jgi:hypothetical protein
MGFLSKFFGMPSFAGATNALLVELTLPKLTASQRAQLKDQLVEVFRRGGFPNTPADVALGDLNRSTRVAQLNFLALAMDELGYQPPLKNEFWHKVRNPFDPTLANESTLTAVANRLKSAHGVEILVGQESLRFDSW